MRSGLHYLLGHAPMNDTKYPLARDGLTELLKDPYRIFLELGCRPRFVEIEGGHWKIREFAASLEGHLSAGRSFVCGGVRDGRGRR
jgi:hypothetical protein